MPANDRKIAEIIFAEINAVEERCPGYREELKEVASDVIAAERQNRIARIKIRQRVEDRINAVGQFLALHRERANIQSEDPSQ